jgi:Right handed beta helix region
MTLSEAHKTLGLSPDEDPTSHLAQFGIAREQIANMVRTAPNSALAARYQQGLDEFDQALALLNPVPHTSSTPEPEVTSLPPPLPKQAFQAPAPTIVLSKAPLKPRPLPKATTASDISPEPVFQEKPTGRPYLGWALAVLTAAVVGAYFTLQYTQDQKQKQQLEIAKLETRGAEMIQAHRWQDATAAYDQIDALSPHSEIAARGKRTIESTMADEQEKFTAYWTEQAATELAAGRLDSAATAVQTLLAKFPNHPTAAPLLAKIDQARKDQLTALTASTPAPPATVPAPAEKEITPHTLRIPGDFPTPAAALAAAHPGDILLLAAGTWAGPLAIDFPLEIQGAGPLATTVQCPPNEGCPLTLGTAAIGVKVSGITFRHTAPLAGNDRYSAALIRGGSATFSDCHFTQASGHGLCVIQSGHATLSRCRFSENGWNGATVTDSGSTLEIHDSEALNNLQHGVEAWAGAALTLIGSRCEANARNGIHADTAPAKAHLTGNQLIANRELGLLLASASSGEISANTASGNLLGGLLVRTPASTLSVTGNNATQNQGPGLILEKGLDPTRYTTNTASANKASQQILSGADITARP